MTNQDIETFFAVLDHGTMTAAAEALYITQPSLSARLKSLEDQVGAPLFHRGKGQRRITLTDAGQHFLPLARRWQNLLSETQTFAAAEKREFLHVIAAYTANQYILPPVYQRFLERELPVNLWVESMRTDQAVSAVARGDADMAIVDGALHYDLQIEAKPLFREGFFLVVPKTVALTEPVEATTLHVQDEILIYGRRGRPSPAVRRHAPAGRDPARLRQALEHHPRRRHRALSADVQQRAGAAPGPPAGGAHLLPGHTQGPRPLRRRGDTAGGPAGADTGSGGHHLVLSSERDTPFGVSLSVVLCRILSYPRRSWPRISRVTASASHPMAGRRSMACP